jgi:protein-tyrosine phosphatase
MAHEYYLAPAAPDEGIVHGACRPGYAPGSPAEDPIGHWADSMQGAGIERVVCLLHRPQLARYLDLLGEYEREFGAEKVCHAPIQDYHLADEATLERVVSFLREADRVGEPAVVHCAAGLGRTGIALAAWLARGRGYAPEEALTTVEEMGRSPREAVRLDNATETELRRRLAGRQAAASDD